jgi:hypothetical protein
MMAGVQNMLKIKRQKTILKLLNLAALIAPRGLKGEKGNPITFKP